MAQQTEWRFCPKCFSMFFNGDAGSNGKCPAGGEHVAQGFQFNLPFDVPETEGQPDWRFCRKCFAMFFDGAPNKGVCPGGGGHENPNIGFHFVLPHDVSETIGQPGWRFCDKCFAMFFDGSQNKGVCPGGGGGHRNPAIGFHFVLPHNGFPTPQLTVNPVLLQIRPELGMRADNFTPLGQFDLTIANMPGKEVIHDSHLFDRKGVFQSSPSFEIVAVPADAELAKVLVTIHDVVSGVTQVQETFPDPWLHRLP